MIFLLELKPGTSEEFLDAYESIRHVVAHGVKGHVVDQVCQAADDPDRWVITSEWETLDDFAALGSDRGAPRADRADAAVLRRRPLLALRDPPGDDPARRSSGRESSPTVIWAGVVSVSGTTPAQFASSYELARVATR